MPGLCGSERCRKLSGHRGPHNDAPTEAWAILEDVDSKKISKAGFATLRGGAKGAYQNHVSRTNRVIVPSERAATALLAGYADGYVFRVPARRYFSGEFQETSLPDAATVGAGAFVLYRTHSELKDYPPPQGWELRSLWKEGKEVTSRGKGVEDRGHYVLRIPAHATGPPQGIFAPEYAAREANYLSQAVLAWLILLAPGSPYSREDAVHLNEVLESAGILVPDKWEEEGMTHEGLLSCPLCLRPVAYLELHATVSFEEAVGLANAPEQVEGLTRSTHANLFHLQPLSYGELRHRPDNVAWGHAVCNTLLGQRRCYSWTDMGVGGPHEGAIPTTDGELRISSDSEMMRSTDGSVWIRVAAPTGDSVVEAYLDATSNLGPTEESDLEELLEGE